MIEALFFTIISFLLFIYMFFKMFKENDTNYVIILVLEALGIAINLVQVLAKVELILFFMIIKYVVGVILPVSVIALEKKEIPLIQLLQNIQKITLGIKC